MGVCELYWVEFLFYFIIIIILKISIMGVCELYWVESFF
jgi:hypothetical protein